MKFGSVYPGTRVSSVSKGFADRQVDSGSPLPGASVPGNESAGPRAATGLLSVMSSRGSDQRPRVEGKFLVLGADKFFVKGTTYGAFPPNTQGFQFPEPDQVA